MTSKYGDLTETIPLFEGRFHIPTIKDAFTVRVARVNGVLAAVDSQGFTYATFKPGDTLNISGTSAKLLLCQVPCTQGICCNGTTTKFCVAISQSIFTTLCYIPDAGQYERCTILGVAMYLDKQQEVLEMALQPVQHPVTAWSLQLHLQN